MNMSLFVKIKNAKRIIRTIKQNGLMMTKTKKESIYGLFMQHDPIAEK